ncbi:MAG: PC4/YdbC family ssDNA-binding protein [Parvimonas sp.]|uniref:YdbC family protein n=1 Tax=Parvimonas sp. TaxID=1944660 RepID=UPI002A75ADCC|nr:PC4/YdbC family ssDNA-binding protein [Parvimonas sp.]MDY3050814.1 PC4/YdbC family ssDNA-binding protein [Parvimonas sp.]
MAEIKFEIKKTILTLNETEEWNKEINLVSWNGREFKLDIREWNKSHTKMKKGIVLTDEEMRKLLESEEIRKYLKENE